MSLSRSRLGMTALNAVPPNKTSYESLEGVPEQDKESLEDKEKPKFGLYSWLVLAIVVLVRVMVQSQRAIFSFAYGYTGTGPQLGNAVYELSTAYP